MTVVLERPRLPRGTTDTVMRRLFPQPSPFVRDPAGWVDTVLDEYLWSKQREICASVVDHRYTAAPSSHDTGKSFSASRLACWWLDTMPDPFVVSTAPSQKQVHAVLWREIRKAKARADDRGRPLNGRITLRDEWYLGHDELVAFGRKPADMVDAEQAMQAFQGIHAESVLVILDEACGIPKWLFDAADALATNENARVLAIGNPDDPASHFAEICKPGSGWNVIPISSFDTPAYTGEEVPEQLHKLLVSKTWVEERKQRWGVDSPIYQSKVLGRFPDISDDTLFPPALLRAACDRELPGFERGGYGGDVARYGEDETVVYRNRGGVLRLVEAARKQATTTTTGMFARILRAHGPDSVPMYVDADGLGAGVYDQLRTLDLPALEWRGGFPAADPERFVNRRAEMFWLLREAMEAGQVDLDPADEDLLAQLGKLKWATDAKGRIQVQSKEDMRRRGVKSPDRADAAAMAFVAPSTPLPSGEPPAGETGEPSSLTGDLLDMEM